MKLALTIYFTAVSPAIAFVSHKSLLTWNPPVTLTQRNLLQEDGEVNSNRIFVSRKRFMNSFVSSSAGLVGFGLLQPQTAAAESRPESLDIDNFLRTGMFG